ncbi:MAG TPA: hypothetical protein GX714_10095, partial [Chloroflexi bacterium]|nr:hypothetical protein [Chloroflexota bacterium]
MASAYDKLRRILTLECEHGCQDRAVIGGLQRFLSYWEKEARDEPPDAHPLPVDAVLEALAGYEQADTETRRDTIIRLLERMTSPPSTAAAPAVSEEASPEDDDA